MKIPYDKKHRWFIYHVGKWDMKNLQWELQRVEECAKLLFKCYKFRAFDYRYKEYFTINMCVRNWLTGDHEPLWTLEREELELEFDRKYINIYQQVFEASENE